jgi:rhamnose transport system ATP-binding protein
VLRLTGLSAGLARNISLHVRAGEIVGLAGLVGSGRSDVLEAIVGLRPKVQGEIERTEATVLLPEDRGRNGIVGPFSVRENLFLPAPGRWLDRRQEQRDGAQWIDRLRIRAAGTDAAIASLSGGNQQKVLLARALRHAPRVLLLDEPTAGIDVGAKAEIHDEIARLAKSGVGVLLASSELPELLQLCDRILALYAGRIVGELSARDATEESVAALITASEPVLGAGC